ncbi:hypothetical protein VD0002_g458 [Verticillium dahliae]|uniref:Early meiotic induction protein 1 n=1 Tax=Verticillium dahliae TaxID=27337 RepID=A0A2J8CH99_VERDA|nr:Zinc finger protein bud20 [Verticillium dahliae VDG2]KAH6702374.1 hypothetical protein EV126DRAFT_225407 [Verticillium dahliae]PNH36402.1 hypothetical protein BJF96_g301 [Verticillium dahliae]PNH45986.1 hypothetical protein VD0004_g2015 [Verticillium dahliae]PNH56775.1 hypothetical protein VD0003_g985 [Verticillium dahliae]
MGWLWATPSPPKTPTPPTDNATSASKTAAPASTETASSDVDPEIQKFLDLFKAERESEPTAPEQSTKAETQPTASSSWFTLKSSATSPSQVETRNAAAPAPKLDPVAESLLPSEMSCRQAFDMAFHCQSIGGQWNAIYREGSMRSCSESWDDFWFCMRVKGYTGKLKEEAIREHYRKKEHEKYGAGKPSSEDVWKARPTRLAPETAFSTTLEDAKVSDEEWQQAEMDRRRKIRRQLGIDEGAKV